MIKLLEVTEFKNFHTTITLDFSDIRRPHPGENTSSLADILSRYADGSVLSVTDPYHCRKA